jgi:phenylpyruvate tautomerase PptA (4-oxalocrotonate tautomerase family)
MPVVTIEFVAESDRPIANDLARSLADAVGRVLNSPPGQTWVRLRSLARNQYAENEAPVDARELPVFVTLRKRRIPSNAEVQAEITALTSAIAKVMDRPASCVHIEYAPAAIGRAAFGGKLVE